MARTAYTIGVDFGTNSARAVVVDCASGRTAGTAVVKYPSGADGVLLDKHDPHLARQNPADYVVALKGSVSRALAQAAKQRGFARDRVIAIGVETTGSTPIPVDNSNRPLALDRQWKKHLAAHAWLWKDHTGAEEAAQVTEAARRSVPEYLAPIGGTYSSEWFWSKIWHCLKTDPEVFHAAASWVELADYIPAVLAGIDNPAKVVRGVCAAGHKAMYAEAWGGLPSRKFLDSLDPALGALRERLYAQAFPADRPSGHLAPEWAKTLGLTAGIPIAMGAFDAHYGAIGAGITAGTFVKIIGTSTCDIAIADASQKLPDIPGICGIVKGSVLPGFYGIEAGQSAVGDLLRWWVEVVCEGKAALHDTLTREAKALAPGAAGLVALDWNNGNRTILVNPKLTGMIVGQTLHTTQAEIYRALVEATAFGARAIIERLTEYRVPIERVVCCGGIAEKNDLFMQVYADVIGMPMLTAGSPQTPALGGAIAAAVAAGVKAGGHDTFAAAQARMTSLGRRAFTPNDKAHRVYNELYTIYRELHDTFGGLSSSANLRTLMPRLLAIRERAITHARAS